MVCNVTPSEALEGFFPEKTGERLSSYTPADYTHAFRKFSDFPGGEVVRVPARRRRHLDPLYPSVRVIGEL